MQLWKLVISSYFCVLKTYQGICSKRIIKNKFLLLVEQNKKQCPLRSSDTVQKADYESF